MLNAMKSLPLYNVERNQLEEAIASAGLPISILSRQAEETIRDSVARFSQQASWQQRTFTPIPWARQYPALFTQTPSGGVTLLPFNYGAYGGWTVTLVSDLRSALQVPPMTLAVNEEQCFGLQVVFPSTEIATHAVNLHGSDLITEPFNLDGLYWCCGPVVYGPSQPPQPQPQPYQSRYRS